MKQKKSIQVKGIKGLKKSDAKGVNAGAEDDGCTVTIEGEGSITCDHGFDIEFAHAAWFLIHEL